MSVGICLLGHFVIMIVSLVPHISIIYQIPGYTCTHTRLTYYQLKLLDYTRQGKSVTVQLNFTASSVRMNSISVGISRVNTVTVKILRNPSKLNQARPELKCLNQSLVILETL